MRLSAVGYDPLMLSFLRNKRRSRLRRTPLPVAWWEIIDRRVSLIRRLTESDRRELGGIVQVLLDEKRFEGCAGLEITDEIRVTICAQAALLLLHRDTRFYPTLKTILVYTPIVDDHGESVALTLDIQIKKIDGKRMLLTPDGQDLVLPSDPEPDPRMLEAFRRAYRIRERLLKSGAPASALARELNINSTLLYKTLSLTHLSPQILRHAMYGMLPPRTTMRDLYRAAESLDWRKQESSLCMHPAKLTASAETPTPAKPAAVAHP